MHNMAKLDASVPQNATVHYSIDNAASKFTVQAFAGGILSAVGHNPIFEISDFSGEGTIADDWEQASIEIIISSASLKVVSEMSAKDRAEVERTTQERVLESRDFPEIVFRCSRIQASKTGEGHYWAAFNGDLTLHGVTRGLTVSAHVASENGTLKASGTFSILQSDYEIKLVSVAGGALKVKDELKFSFQIVARQRE